MSHGNQPDPLDELLRALPRVRASEGFTSRVLAQLPERPEHRERLPVLAWAAAALLLLGLVLGGLRMDQQQTADRRASRAAELRSKHRDLQEELAHLRILAEEERPVIYLGGNEQIDLVLDLTAAEERVAPTYARPLEPRLAAEARAE